MTFNDRPRRPAQSPGDVPPGRDAGPADDGPAPLNRALVSAVGLRKGFHGLEAVAGVTFSAASGECLGILGPNGAGKSTLVRMVCCVSPPDSGELNVFGRPVRDCPRLIKARLGVCPQEDNLDPDLDVRQNLLVYAGYFGITGRAGRAAAERLLDFVNLRERAASPATELSGGMKRRLVFARALVNNPALMVLDEPTTGLDPQVRRELWQYIDRLKSGGTSFLLTTHYMEEAARLCDRVIIMDKGEIIAAGRPAELVARHIGRTIIETGADGPGRPALEALLAGRALRRETVGGRLLISGDDNSALHEELDRRFPGLAFQHRMANLEDVFLKLTGRTLNEADPAGDDPPGGQR